MLVSLQVVERGYDFPSKFDVGFFLDGGWVSERVVWRLLSYQSRLVWFFSGKPGCSLPPF